MKRHEVLKLLIKINNELARFTVAYVSYIAIQDAVLALVRNGEMSTNKDEIMNFIREVGIPDNKVVMVYSTVEQVLFQAKLI